MNELSDRNSDSREIIEVKEKITKRTTKFRNRRRPAELYEISHHAE